FLGSIIGALAKGLPSLIALIKK
uniref:Brevinin-1OKd n=2 Tax=Ranidae TaxID=8397 RepID=BR1D_NIDOK|nr:RecName: Full=Brevinin-1OKd [Nidirana okinavana]